MRRLRFTCVWCRAGARGGLLLRSQSRRRTSAAAMTQKHNKSSRLLHVAHAQTDTHTTHNRRHSPLIEWRVRFSEMAHVQFNTRNTHTRGYTAIEVCWLPSLMLATAVSAVCDSTYASDVLSIIFACAHQHSYAYKRAPELRVYCVDNGNRTARRSRCNVANKSLPL